MCFLTFFFRSGGAPGLPGEYQGVLRSEKTMKIIGFMMEKKLHQKRNKNPILRGSTVRCLNPPKPVPDPKIKKIQNQKTKASREKLVVRKTKTKDEGLARKVNS